MRSSFVPRSRETAVENLSGVQIDFLLFLQSSKFIYQSTRVSYKTPSRTASSFFVPSGFRSSRCREFLVFKFSRLAGATFSLLLRLKSSRSLCTDFCRTNRCTEERNESFQRRSLSANEREKSVGYAPYQRPPCIHPCVYWRLC